MTLSLVLVFVLLLTAVMVMAGRKRKRSFPHADPDTYRLHRDRANAGSSAVMSLVDRDSFNQTNGPPVKMNIGLLCVGTTGDLNPFLVIGMELQAQGHRVRLATHELYRDKVLARGLEYYPLAGDPKKLSEFMVNSAGKIIPTKKSTILAMKDMKDIVEAIFFSTWLAMVEPDPISKAPFRP